MSSGRADPPGGPRSTLLEPHLQQEFERDGFVTVPFLDGSAVERAREVYDRLAPGAGHGFETDFERPDPRRKQAIHDAMLAITAGPLDALLDRYRPFMTTFLAKWPGPGGELYLHQDWTYVDERCFRSVVVWVALQDIDPENRNGPLQVLPGSHRITGELRGTLTSPWHADHHAALAPSLVSVSVPSGHAVVMDNALLHASPENRSGDVRLAAALACVPVEATLLHAVAGPDQLVKVLDVDDQFFRTQTPRSLRAHIPDRWAATARETGPADPPTDLDLAGRLSGTDLRRPDGGNPLGDSVPLPPRHGPTGRVLGTALAINHRRIARRHPQPGAFLDPAAFTWLGRLVRSSSSIADEYRRACGTDASVPLRVLAASDLPNLGPWRGLLLRDNRGWDPAGVARCPRTAELLRDVPGLRSAMFSVLGPWSRIERHRGPNKGVLRAHLGIEVPGPEGRVTLWAGDDQRSWKTGEAFVFDDTFEHRVANRTDGWRVSLMIEFDRPLRGLDRLTNQVVQRAFALHPQVRGAQTRRRDIQLALDS